MKTQLKAIYDNTNHETSISSEKVGKLIVITKIIKDKAIALVSVKEEVRFGRAEKNHNVHGSDGSTNN